MNRELVSTLSKFHEGRMLATVLLAACAAVIHMELWLRHRVGVTVLQHVSLYTTGVVMVRTGDIVIPQPKHCNQQVVAQGRAQKRRRLLQTAIISIQGCRGAGLLSPSPKESPALWAGSLRAMKGSIGVLRVLGILWAAPESWPSL